MDSFSETKSPSECGGVQAPESEESMNNQGKVPQAQKDAAVAELNAGGRAKEIARKLGVSDAAIYQWRMKTGYKPKSVKKKKKNIVVVSHPTAAALYSQRNAILALRKGKQELVRGLKSGQIQDIDDAHLMAMVALKSLLGD